MRFSVFFGKKTDEPPTPERRQVIAESADKRSNLLSIVVQSAIKAICRVQILLTKDARNDASEESSEGALDFHRHVDDFVNLDVPRSVTNTLDFAEQLIQNWLRPYKYPLKLKIWIDVNKCDQVTLYLYSFMVPENYRADKFMRKANVLYLKAAEYSFGALGVLPKLNFQSDKKEKKSLLLKY